MNRLKKPNNLTPIEEHIFEFFKNNQFDICNLTLKEICNQLYVSNATIVRFTQKMGFSGFAEFKSFLKNSLQNVNNFNLTGNYFGLEEFSRTINEADIESISDLIIESKTIYIYGRGISSTPAEYLHCVLNTLDIYTINIDWIDLLLSISETIQENSLVIMFSNKTDRKEYYQVAHNCYENKANVIWISDNSFSDEMKSLIKIGIPTRESVIDGYNVTTKMYSLFFVQMILERVIYLKEVA